MMLSQSYNLYLGITNKPHPAILPIELLWAIFAIILPILRAIQLEQDKKATETLKKLESEMKSSSKTDKVKLKDISEHVAEFEGELELGAFSKAFILGAFSLYIFSALASFEFLNEPNTELGTLAGNVAPYFFVAATILFLITGVNALSKQMNVISEPNSVEKIKEKKKPKKKKK